MKTLTEVKAEVDRRAAIMGAAGHWSLPTYGHSEDFARPHIEVDSRGYHLVVVERGQELSRFTTHDLDELLYRVFQGVTSIFASGYELMHRIETKDCRRLIFQRQVELLSQLSARWAEREAEEHRRILGEHPFDDNSGIRASLARELSEAGCDPQTAWQMACERYPLSNIS
jgi:Immunity protein 63